jgi:hypothetical protein
MNLEGVKIKLHYIPEMYRNFLYYKVWERKGKVIGINNDFGRLSLLNSNEIPSNYHCSQEEIVEILLEVINILENIDQK